MTIKEILSEITEYLSLSPIAHNRFGKSRQWLYHKINEDVINKVQYKLSDEEIDILISALDDIKSNIYNVIQNLEEFKEEREYLKIPQEERLMLEDYDERLRELSNKRQKNEMQDLIKEMYKSTTSIPVIEMLDGWVNYNSWNLLNLKGESIKYDGNHIRLIVTKIMEDIQREHEEQQTKRKRRKKNEEDDDEENDNTSDDSWLFNWRNNILPITYKIYYKLNELTASTSLQETINKIPKKISSLGNIKVSEVEKLVYEELKHNIEE